MSDAINVHARTFRNGILISKVIFLTTLIVLAFVNVDVSFISSNPRDFLFESFLVGLGTALPITFLSYNRDADWSRILNLTLISFLGFFLFNVLVEFSGLNHTSDDTLITLISDQKQQALLTTIKGQIGLYVVVGLVALVLMFLAYRVWDLKTISVRLLILEAIVFALFNAIPQGVIAKDRGGNVGLAIGTSFGLFVVGFLILQTGGFFRELSN